MRRTITLICVFLLGFTVHGQTNKSEAPLSDAPVIWSINFNDVFETPDGWQNIDHSNSGVEWYFSGMRAETFNYFEEDDEPRTHASLITEAIDCSDYSGVSLSVNHKLSFYGGFDSYVAKVLISVDGANWTTVSEYTGLVEYDGDDASHNLPYHEYDISSIADGQNEVYIRFEFNGNDSNDMEWAIQKMELFPVPAAQVPYPAILHAPANGINLMPDDLSHIYLEWNPAEEGPAADGYRVYFGEENPPTNLIYQGSTSFHQPAGLEWEKEFFWKVIPYNSEGDAVDVPVWQFSTYELMTVWEETFQIIDDILPDWDVDDLSGSTHVWNFNGVRAVIETPWEKENIAVWSTMTSPVIDCTGFENIRLFVNQDWYHELEFDSYYGKIEISTDGQNWQDVTVFEGNIMDAKFDWGLPYYEYNVSAIANNQPHVWVRFEFNSNDDWDLAWDIDKVGFLASAMDLEPVTLLTPPNDATNQLLDVYMNWQAGPGIAPDGYRLYLDENNPPQTMVYEGASTSFSSPDLDYETTYFWKVVPFLGEEEATDAQVWSFTTISDPGISQVPHYENFDQVLPPDLPYGWSSLVESTSTWASVRTYCEESDPFDQVPYSEPNHVRFSNSGHVEAGLFLFTSPLAPALENLRVRFYAKANSNVAANISPYNAIEVGTITDISNSSAFTPLGSVYITPEYDHYMVSLAGHASNDNIIAFRASMGDAQQYLYIDDIVIEEIPEDPMQVVLPDIYDFGPVENNYDIKTKAFSIRNWGGGVITLNPEDIYLEGPGADAYTLENISAAVTLEAFGQVEVSLIFEPSTPGVKQITLRVGEMAIPITGTSVHPDIVQLPHLENFDQVVAPELPLGWRAIVHSSDPQAAVVTLVATSHHPSSPNVIRFRNESDGDAQMYLISPLIEPGQDVEELWVRFFSRPYYRHDYMVIGTMTDRDDVSTFTEVEKIWLYPESGVFWEYAARIPVVGESFYVVMKPDFYRRQRGIFIDDVIIDVAPQLFPVNIVVKEDSPETASLEGVSLKVLGHSPITERVVSTTSDGAVDIQLEAGTYTIFANLKGYHEKEIMFTVDDQANLVDIRMQHAIYAPYNISVKTEDQEPGEALMVWNDPNDIFEFRYDDGRVEGSLGFHGDYQQELRALGSAYHYLAELHQVSWYLTNDLGPHDTLQLWITGLDQYGYPDVNQILYWNDRVPNIDDEWNTYELPEPIMTPNGFYIGLGYEGFLSLARDNGETHPYQFIPERQFAVGNMHGHSEMAFPIEMFGYQVNLLLRGHGYIISTLEFEETPWPKMEELPELELIATSKRLVGEPKVNIRHSMLQPEFHVFLDDMDAPFASWLNGTEYLFSGLESGTYTAGVQTAFSTGVSEIVDVTFTIEQGATNIQLPEGVEMKVFPNPASNLLQVVAGEMIQEVRMYDLLGQLVYTATVKDTHTRINVGHLREGVYMLQVQTAVGQATHRILITK